MPTKKDLESKARSKGLDLWDYAIELLTEAIKEACASAESKATIEEGNEISQFHQTLAVHFPQVPDPNDLPLLGSEEDIGSYVQRLAKKLLGDRSETSKSTMNDPKPGETPATSPQSFSPRPKEENCWIKLS